MVQIESQVVEENFRWTPLKMMPKIDSNKLSRVDFSSACLDHWCTSKLHIDFREAVIVLSQPVRSNTSLLFIQSENIKILLY